MAVGQEQYTLLFNIVGNSSSAVSALSNVNQASNATSAGLTRLGASAASFIGNLSSDVLQSLTSALKDGAKAVLDYSARMEQTKIGFTSLLGNAQKATQVLKELRDFSIKTPFDFESLAKVAQRMIGVGIETQKIIPLMRDLGNIVAATGDVSAERLEGISTALTQMISKTRVSAEEMEQLAERGVPAWKLLSDALGKSQKEVRKLAEDGKISADVMVAALQRMSQQKFGDAMQKQAETFKGSINVIKNLVMQTASTMFEPIFKEISKFAGKFAKNLKQQEAPVKSIAFAFGKTIGESMEDGVLTALGRLGKKMGDFWIGAGQTITDFTKGVREGVSQPRVPKSFDYRRPSDVEVINNKPIELPQSVDLEKARKEAEDLAKRNLAAGIQYWKNYVEQIKKKYDEAIQQFKEDFEKDGNAQLLQERIGQANQKYIDLINQANVSLVKLEDTQIKIEKKTNAEIAVIMQERATRFQEWWNKAAKTLEESQTWQTKKAEEETEKRLSITEKQGQRELELFKSNADKERVFLDGEREKNLLDERLYVEKLGQIKLSVIEKEKEIAERRLADQTLDTEKREELMNRIKILDNEIAAQMAQNALDVTKAIEETTQAFERLSAAVGAAGGGDDGGLSPSNESDVQGGGLGGAGGTKSSGLFGNLFSGFLAGLDESLIKLQNWSSVVQSIGQTVAGVFMQIGQGVGSMVESWVLLGDSSNVSMKKMVASVLSGVAMQSAVLAVFHTAMGIAALTPWGAVMYGNPFFHFKAAALWTGIAAGTALLGRAVAGDAFKSQTNTATGSGGGSSGSRGNASAFSGQGDKVVETSRNEPSGNIFDRFLGKLVIQVESKDSHIVNVIENDVSKNGRMRRLIIQTANGA